MKPWYKGIIAFTFLLVIILLGYFSWEQRIDELIENGKETTAILVEVKGSKRHACYQFSDGLQSYKGKTKVHTSFLAKHRIGDAVTIIYSSSNPTISKIKYR